ncbi:MAG: hypothetical protein R8K22_00185 [Mariprofundaceae bacterium]
MTQSNDVFNRAAQQSIELANKLSGINEEAEAANVSAGLLSAATHHWLFTHQPCEVSNCKDCEPINTPKKRLQELLKITEEFANQSEYFNTAHDVK